MEGTSHLQKWLEFCLWPGFILRLLVTLKPRLRFIPLPYICSLNPFSFMGQESGISINWAWSNFEGVQKVHWSGTDHLLPTLMKNVLNNRLKFGITIHPADFIYFAKFDHLLDINATVYLWKVDGHMLSMQVIHMFITEPASQRNYLILLHLSHTSYFIASTLSALLF